ncbi:MAG: hypothetical protein U5R31_11995 [Acidimicrobiia bacterium]|nr:hypothetical protein [Acidimicrobiia bacterium]
MRFTGGRDARLRRGLAQLVAVLVLGGSRSRRGSHAAPQVGDDDRDDVEELREAYDEAVAAEADLLDAYDTSVERLEEVDERIVELDEAIERTEAELLDAERTVRAREDAARGHRAASRRGRGGAGGRRGAATGAGGRSLRRGGRRRCRRAGPLRGRHGRRHPVVPRVRRSDRRGPGPGRRGVCPPPRRGGDPPS